MLYGDTVQDTRQHFFSTWFKYTERQPLTPLENQLLAVILEHPEYHAILDKQDLHARYTPELGETNPFLHMGLHLTIAEQVSLNRPLGIQSIFQQLCIQHNDKHHAEHALLEPLMDCLWTAQKHQTMPDEQRYLLACRRLVNPIMA